MTTGPAGPVYEAIVLDAETGQVLRQLNPDAVTYPASLTKMMTLYLTFEALNQGRLKLDQYLPVSAAAAAHSPSKLGLQPGQAVTVRDLILGIVTKSANDAAAVLAEGLGGGSEAGFAVMMTQRAQQLGMTRTHYANASGLPDPEQLTTARDVARLALALYHDFPREYRYFSVTKFDFNGEIVNGHDHMLGWYPGADGIKTGFTVASGYNLATSAVQNGRRLIGVILGGRSIRGRDESMAQMLDLGFGDLARAPSLMVAQQQIPAALVAAATPITALAAVRRPQAPAVPGLDRRRRDGDASRTASAGRAAAGVGRVADGGFRSAASALGSRDARRRRQGGDRPFGAGRQGRGGFGRARAGRRLGHPARRLPRRSSGGTGRARDFPPRIGQGQATADPGTDGRRAAVSRAAPLLLAAGRPRRLRGTAQAAHRLLYRPGDRRQDGQPLDVLPRP